MGGVGTPPQRTQTAEPGPNGGAQGDFVLNGGVLPFSRSLPGSLAAAVEGLYTAFERYPLGRHVEGCTCGCIPPGAEAALHGRPLRELTPDDLERYAFKALTTWGDEEDFRHFLPRLLELLARKDLMVNEEIVLGKLAYGQWWNWPPPEYGAVAAFLHAWWSETLRQPAPEESWLVATALTAVAQAEDDLTPYLEEWDAAPPFPGLWHVAAFVMGHAGELVEGKLTFAFWEARQPQARQVVVWLLREGQQRRLEAASRRFSLHPGAEVLTDAAYILGIAQNQRPSR